jgi:DtxR family Mn-dependent transcriptional regulator
MATHNSSSDISESTEMYLLRIDLLARSQSPVPIARLAEALEVSPISANQMCRKLEARQLVSYQPYKGVTLTQQGETIARNVLHKRHLWEQFLADKLGLAADVAEEIACRLEHVTPGELVEKLTEFLKSPEEKPDQSRPLSTLGVNQQARILRIEAEEALATFLHAQHLLPDAAVKILARSENTLLVQIEQRHLSLSTAVAQNIIVTL